MDPASARRWIFLNSSAECSESAFRLTAKFMDSSSVTFLSCISQRALCKHAGGRRRLAGMRGGTLRLPRRQRRAKPPGRDVGCNGSGAQGPRISNRRPQNGAVAPAVLRRERRPGEGASGCAETPWTAVLAYDYYAASQGTRSLSQLLSAPTTNKTQNRVVAYSRSWQNNENPSTH